MDLANNYYCREIESPAEMLEQLPLLQQLNARLDAANYERMLQDMLRCGYRMAGVFSQGRCVGLSGYWLATKLYCGRYLEMDNVVIDPSCRSMGLGKLLSDYLLQRARQEQCQCIMLDAYLENENAHRFYEREGFKKKGYHFIKSI